MASSSARAALWQRISRPELSERVRDALERGALVAVAEAGFWQEAREQTAGLGRAVNYVVEPSV